MDVRGYALTISIVAGAAAWLCRHRRCPTCRTFLPSTRSLPAAAMLLMPASMTGTEIALAAIPAMPAATATGSAPPGIGNRADKLEGWGLKPAKALEPAKALGLTSRSHLSAPT
jgi:hypothetical protein